MILGRDLPTSLGLELKFSDRVIVGSKGLYEGYSAPMVDVINWDYTFLTGKIVKPEEPLLNLYVDKYFELESTINPTQQTRRILYANYKKVDINKVMTKQCQQLST